jgi:4-hydroxy-2-oxoheptanedioate aldolase
MTPSSTPVNRFKQNLLGKRSQMGLWLSLANPYSAEICALAGFDWVLIDGEHAPNDLRSILAQLHVLAGYPQTQALVRVPNQRSDTIKQVLDLGVQTVVVPMVDTPEQAQALVAACRYPQNDGGGGIRGVAGARASRWGMHPRYVHEANAQVCLVVQAETAESLQHLDAIAATPGVDAVFIGPSDLSASLGYVGEPGHPKVQAAINEAVTRVQRAGKAVGILSTDDAQTRAYVQRGLNFIASGLDTRLLLQSAVALARRFDDAQPTS